MHKLSRNLLTDDIVSSLTKETFGGKGPKFNILIFNIGWDSFLIILNNDYFYAPGRIIVCDSPQNKYPRTILLSDS